MLMAADPQHFEAGVALAVGMSVVADVLDYSIIGPVVWSVAAWNHGT